MKVHYNYIENIAFAYTLSLCVITTAV